MPGQLDIVTVILGVLVAAFLCVAVVYIVNSLLRAAVPKTTAPAQVVARRSAVSGIGDLVSTHYYLTFQMDDGVRLELRVPGKVSGLMVDQDRGVLEYRGDTFMAFTRG